MEELAVPCWNIRGTMEERLAQIVDLFDLPVVMPVADAIVRMEAEYAAVDKRLENERQAVGRA